MRRSKRFKLLVQRQASIKKRRMIRFITLLHNFFTGFAFLLYSYQNLFGIRPFFILPVIEKVAFLKKPIVQDDIYHVATLRLRGTAYHNFFPLHRSLKLRA